MNLESWDKRFLSLAEFISSWSKDPSTKVGAVIVDQKNRIVSVGFNGFPTGIKDDDRLVDREEKYKIIVHGEMNAILFANRNLENCTLYTFPFMPCPKCAAMIVQAGISKVISYTNKNDRWEQDFQVSRSLFNEAGIILEEYAYYE